MSQRQEFKQVQVKDEFDHRDAIQETLEKWAKDCGACTCNACETCCNGLQACLTSIGKILESCCISLGTNLWEATKYTADGTNALVVQPVWKGASQFFRDESGQLNWYSPVQPGIDAFKGFVLNPALVAVDPLISVKKNGNCGFPLLVNPLARTLEFFSLLTSSCNSSLSADDRTKNTAAAALALIFAGYFGVQSLGVAGAAMGLSSFAGNPMTMFMNAIRGNSLLLQKLGIYASGYFGLTNGYVMGRDLALHEFEEWKKNLWASVNTKALERHLDEMDQIVGKDAKAKAEAEYQKAASIGKAWKKRDLAGEVLASILKLPALVFQGFAHNTKKISFLRAWLEQNGHNVYQKTKSRVANARRDNDSCASAVVDCLGIKTFDPLKKPLLADEKAVKAEEKIDNAAEAKKVYPSYEELLKAKKAEYYAPVAYARSFWNDAEQVNQVRDETQNRKLTNDLKADYLNDAKLIAQGKPLGNPVLPKNAPCGVPAEFKYDEGSWQERAANDPEIQKMLKDEFPDPQMTTSERMAFYQACKYAHFAGRPERVAELVKQFSPPGYDASENAHPAIAVTVEQPSAPEGQQMSPRKP